VFILADALKNTILEIIENGASNKKRIVFVKLPIKAQIKWFYKKMKRVSREKNWAN